jgi:hypothetical protein
MYPNTDNMNNNIIIGGSGEGTRSLDGLLQIDNLIVPWIH